MQLQSIDKSTYRKRLNIVITGCIAALIILSLGFSQTIIYLLDDGKDSHFYINLAGVIFGMIVIATVLQKLRIKEYMKEVVYIWELKQILNKIQRKSRQLDAAVKQNDTNAIIIQYYNYKACHQLYSLDDNTITMSELARKANDLDEKIESLNLSVKEQDFDIALLNKF